MRNGRIGAGLLAAGLAALPAAEGRAQTVNASDPSSVVRAIQAYGHVATLAAEDDGSPRVDGEVDGLLYSVYFYSCDEARRACQDLLFDGSFDLEAPISATYVNNWNAGRVAGTALVDENGNAHLSLFVTTSGGLSAANFRAVLDVWSLAFGDFAAEVFGDKNATGK